MNERKSSRSSNIRIYETPNNHMKFKPSILNIHSIIFLAGCLGFTIYNYDQLSEGEGWGMVGMVGLFGLGVFLLVIDLVLRNIIKNRTATHIIGLAIAVAATMLVITSGMFS